MNYNAIIDYYYSEADEELRNILLVHSKSVADLALQVCRSHPELHADEDFVYNAAMLHDIGIIRCDAPSIHCFGKEQYICHGTIGARMILELPDSITDIDADTKERLARVCARHTGTGLTAETIYKQNLPLPPQDLRPETIEERIVCYADKFFSKTHLDKCKTYEQALKSLAKFGEEGLIIFAQWHKIFSVSE